jgi:hypothetical protein
MINEFPEIEKDDKLLKDWLKLDFDNPERDIKFHQLIWELQNNADLLNLVLLGQQTDKLTPSELEYLNKIIAIGVSGLEESLDYLNGIQEDRSKN